VEGSEIIDDCILVTGEGDISYMRCEIVEKYGFHKVETVIAGGSERCFSVANALRAMGEALQIPNRDGYVFIHDGARPFVSKKIIEDTYETAAAYGACCAAVPVKDTIKAADGNGFVERTLDRSRLFSIQTPQVFAAPLILEAYRLLTLRQEELVRAGVHITDDAMVVESMLKHPVKLVEASGGNIKITTPEDMELAEFLASRIARCEK
jgi:2-C-methyl-D-erythritol 4-phosphate cytidylyltransferase